MPAIVSLERFKAMSEHAQDESAELPSGQDSAEAPALDENTPQDEPAAQAAASKAGKAENDLPPEAQGETNGGPLGCCLGTMIGLLLSLSLAVLSRAYATSLGGVLLGNFWLLGLLVRILMGILAFALAIFFGYLGWRLGRRFYREYNPPPMKRRNKRSKPRKLPASQ
jgi:hypothetical protein